MRGNAPSPHPATTKFGADQFLTAVFCIEISLTQRCRKLTISREGTRENEVKKVERGEKEEEREREERRKRGGRMRRKRRISAPNAFLPSTSGVALSSIFLTTNGPVAPHFLALSEALRPFVPVIITPCQSEELSRSQDLPRLGQGSPDRRRIFSSLTPPQAPAFRLRRFLTHLGPQVISSTLLSKNFFLHSGKTGFSGSQPGRQLVSVTLPVRL